MTITDWHIMGYNGYWDGYWATPAQAVEELTLDPESKPAQALRRGIELAISEERDTNTRISTQNASEGEF